jgi:hypothetical protein
MRNFNTVDLPKGPGSSPCGQPKVYKIGQAKTENVRRKVT